MDTLNKTGALAIGFFVVSTLILVTPAMASNEYEVTFAKDVAPILQRSCQSCHRPGSLAPMSFFDLSGDPTVGTFD